MKRLFILLILISCLACQQDSPRHVNFYHWKSSFELKPTEQDYLQKLNSQKIYLRFFDLKVKNGQAYPEAVLKANTYKAAPEIIPTIYITNAALLATAESDLGKFWSLYLQHQAWVLYKEPDVYAPNRQPT